jgi:hypothetical protein
MPHAQRTNITELLDRYEWFTRQMNCCPNDPATLPLRQWALERMRQIVRTLAAEIEPGFSEDRCQTTA